MRINTPSNLDTPSFLMNFPFSVSNKVRNNVWMEDYDDDEDIIKEYAFEEFLNLYHFIAKEALVYLLPSEGDFQDQVYVANLGCYLPHIKDLDVMLVANYKSEPRIGEDKVGIKFFKSMGYHVDQPETHWEGEADLKYLRNNIYIAGYGIRTDKETHKWFEKQFNMEILPVYMDDAKLYHLDCLIMPLGPNKVFAATQKMKSSEVRKIEKYAEIIPVPDDYIYHAWTNGAIVNNKFLYGYFEEYENDRPVLEKIISNQGLEPVGFALDEFGKSGAALSCMLLTLNRTKNI